MGVAIGHGAIELFLSAHFEWIEQRGENEGRYNRSPGECSLKFKDVMLREVETPTKVLNPALWPHVAASGIRLGGVRYRLTVDPSPSPGSLISFKCSDSSTRSCRISTGRHISQLPCRITGYYSVRRNILRNRQ